MIIKIQTTILIYLLLIGTSLAQEKPPIKTLSEWQTAHPFTLIEVDSFTRCDNKKSFRYTSKCYRRRMIYRYKNSINTYVYFSNSGKSQGYSNDACLGFNACFGFGKKEKQEVITNIAAWGILPDDPRWVWEAWKIAQYEDAWRALRAIKLWCSKRFKGEIRGKCIKGFLKIKDPNLAKFTNRPKFKLSIL